MLQQIGMLIQLAVLVLLPMLVFWQLTYGFRVGVMGPVVVLGMIAFTVGAKLRESR